MANQTPRRGLNTYEEGEGSWSHTDVVEDHDELSIERDVIANRPAEGEYDDEMFYATDQKIYWKWDADAVDWEAVGGPGSSSKRFPGTVYREAVDTDVLGTRGYLKSGVESRHVNQGIGMPQPIPGNAAMFEDLTDWSTASSNTTLTADTTTVYSGSQSATFENDGNGNSAAIEYTFASAVDLTDLHPTFVVNVASPLDQSFEFRVSLFDSAGNHQSYEREYDGRDDGQGWVNLHPAASYNGGGDLTDITDFQILAEDLSGKAEINIDAFQFVEGHGKSYFVFTFDDGHETVYDNAFPILEEYGYPAGVGVISSAVGDASRMSLTELQELQARGYTMMNHTSAFDSYRQDNLSLDEWESNVRDGKQWMLENGLLNGEQAEESHFVYPRGEWDADALEVVDKYHDYAYLAGPGSYINSAGAYRNLLTIPRGAGTDPSTVTGRVDEAIRTNQITIATIHTVGSSGEISESELRTICDHLDGKSRDDVEVVSPHRLAELMP